MLLGKCLNMFTAALHRNYLGNLSFVLRYFEWKFEFCLIKLSADFGLDNIAEKNISLPKQTFLTLGYHFISVQNSLNIIVGGFR